MTASGISPGASSDASRTDRRGALVAVIVSALGFAASYGVARLVLQQERDAAQARFERRAGHVTTTLRQELLTAATVLRGARGMLGSNVSPAAVGWPNYQAQLDLDRARSPIRSLGFVDAKIVIGATQTNVDPQTRDALLRAADSGLATLDAHATPSDRAYAPDSGVGALSLYLPVYTENEALLAAERRRASTSGFVVATLDARRLVELSTANDRDIDLRLTAGEPGTLVYATDREYNGADMSHPPLARTEQLNFGGAPLTLAYTTENRWAAIRSNAVATTVLVAGAATSALLAALAYLLVSRLGARAANADDSPINEARMMGIIRSSMEAIITIDETQTVVIFNPAAERVFGVSAMDAIGSPLARFIPERFRAAHTRHVEQFGVTGVSDRQMGSQRVLFGLRENGEEFPIEASISQIRDGSGKLYTVMLRDVTERVRAETALRQSREELRELSANLQNVREEEKTRIARELHDDLGQQLTALKMDVSAIAIALARYRDEQPDAQPVVAVEQQLHGMRRLIDSTVASVRRIAADLRPVMLDDLGLVPAIEWLANDFTNRYGIDVERRLDTADTSFSNAGATTLFRIVQEALTNVARHADATRVTLMLAIDQDLCVLQIKDDGRGVQPDERRDAHGDKSFGLIGIRERAHMLSGTVTTDSAPGHGFSIKVALPLAAIRQQDAFS
ncbi:PAS domain S-box protein [Burkholderia oklahomensis]|uniref:PAS domain S-box protein n=1 Tax=Burkholderia oklahomensis TaxID=342113 RepID=UPI00016A86C3|nr:PAS domain S-box protein [Burkholderia oklahomensis]AJX34492.1 response regulator [Burkholderia oklahomensis C6786]AOI48945.1 histidine kinase [Burkholderia oklahomensis C6786]KUY50455.1 histidine kinase [Burkholderia oklahomensis C6786]MBI0362840.1 PAS domain S-box protein [Burkholderia oklahomensis]SUY26948.1 Sensor protein degS [Burkholderia oklahomensis]